MAKPSCSRKTVQLGLPSAGASRSFVIRIIPDRLRSLPIQLRSCAASMRSKNASSMSWSCSGDSTATAPSPTLRSRPPSMDSLAPAKGAPGSSSGRSGMADAGADTRRRPPATTQSESTGSRLGRSRRVRCSMTRAFKPSKARQLSGHASSSDPTPVQGSETFHGNDRRPSRPIGCSSSYACRLRTVKVLRCPERLSVTLVSRGDEPGSGKCMKKRNVSPAGTRMWRVLCTVPVTSTTSDLSGP